MAKTILTPLQKQVIISLSKDTHFLNRFYFTGGTALAEYYLKHRLSEDLDFFSPEEIDSLWLTILANKLKKYIGASEVDIQQAFNRTLIFYTIGREVLKTEFTYFPFVQIEKPKVIDAIKVDSLIDIAVNKFFTLYQSPAARHFIDLYLIMKTKKIKWDKLKKLARIKFDVHIDPLQLGSQFMAAADVRDLPKMLINLSEKEWRNYFVKRARELKSEIENKIP